MKNYSSSKLSNCILLVFVSLLSVQAQFSNPDKPVEANKSSYLFPIRPGVPASLAGTMGELRATHFHSGIDIRTNNEIGWPVLAANDGYISRASVSGSGFGNALYVTHPDGNFTVYGHLENFKGAVDEYIRKERYRRKTSAIDLYFRQGQFPVKKGDTIAFAGNTGSSGGPHLHFDIRDKNNHALDPLQFNFPEVHDVAPPVAQKIALKTLGINSRINDQFGRFEYYLLKSGNNFMFNAPILANGDIGIELLAYDRVDNPRYKCGINEIELFVNDKKVFHQTIDKFNIAESRGIYTLMDFKTARTKGTRFYKLYVDDGNKLNFYSGSPSQGIVQVNSETAQIRIVMYDVYRNKSIVNFTLKHSEPLEEVKTLEATSKLSYEIFENLMMIETPVCQDSTIATVFSKGNTTLLKHAYTGAKKSVYLIDLRQTLPDSIRICNETLVTNFKSMVVTNQEFNYFSTPMDIRFPARSLYDTLYLQANHLVLKDSSELFEIGNSLIPLQRSISVSLKPVLHYNRTKQTAVYRKVGKAFAYEGGSWVNDRINFSTSEMGSFTLLKDTIPPTITPLYISSQAVRFRIRDNLSGIQSFEANINGKWLLLNYDAKTATIESERYDKNERLRGEIEVIVTDNAGNKQIFKQTLPAL